MSQSKSVEDRLNKFRKEHAIAGKGALSLVLTLTRRAIEKGLPLNPAGMMTKGGGQISGSGKSAVQRVLRDYGIQRVLAKEGSRTNRGAPKQMKGYVTLLNQLHSEGFTELKFIEGWWIERVKEYFSAKGFKLVLAAGDSIQSAWETLFASAEKVQAEIKGDTTLGAMLQHLVGAKLELLLGTGAVTHHGHAVADEATGRNADFVVADVCFHATTAPSEALIAKCEENLQGNLRPIVVTLSPAGVQTARQLAKHRNLAGRIDCFEAAQFLTTNVYEWSFTKMAERRATVENLIACCNKIVTAHETNPRLKIELA